MGGDGRAGAVAPHIYVRPSSVTAFGRATFPRWGKGFEARAGYGWSGPLPKRLRLHMKSMSACCTGLAGRFQ